MFAIYLNDVHAARSLTPRSCIILYMNDILLIAHSISELQNLCHLCEIELNWLYMSINEKKSCCIRIRPRSDLKCTGITTSNGHNLPWVNEVRYLGTYRLLSTIGTLNALQLKPKKSYHRSINASFGKVGRIASKEVILHLVKTKCLPI